jgi:CSLREA domain-containing protein
MRLISGFGVLILVCLVSPAAGAATIVARDLVDDTDTSNGTCTLREALRSANTNLSVDACTAGSAVVADVIQVLPGIHVVDLSSGNDEDSALTGDLDVLGPVTIQGSAADYSIIDGTGAGASDRLFHVHQSANAVNFIRVALRGGTAADTTQGGGVLWNLESGSTPVQLVEVEISEGHASGGGGILNDGNMTILRSRVFDNQTSIDLASENNHGGGIASQGFNARLRIEDSEISGNQAGEDGGGLWIDGGAFVLYRSRIDGNQAGRAGGGLLVGSTDYDVDYVEFSDNDSFYGGGVFMTGAGEVKHSAFVGNQATVGGGLFDSFGGFVRFSTISGNTAMQGAGVYANSNQTLLDSNTIARNFGEGVYNDSGVFLENTLLAENSGGNCAGTAPAFGAFNLDDANSCGFVSSAGTPNFPNTAPLLGPLQNNGGPTRTMALLPGSPAIDVVTSEIRMNCEQMRDQRGHPRGRPRTQNGLGEDVYLCDLGAFEVTSPFVVDSLADAVDADLNDDICSTTGGVCTLRAAVQQANQIAGFNEIELGAGTHLLSLLGAGDDVALTGDLDVDPPVLIRGAGPSLTSIDGNGIDRVFDIGSPDHDADPAPEVAVVKDLSVTLGDSGLENGGGFLARKNLRIERVEVVDNAAPRGSAISTAVSGSLLGGNTIVEIVDSSISNNTGGMALFASDARIDSSSLIGNTNTSTGNGGAGELLSLSLRNSTVSGNSGDASGAFFASQAVVESSTVYGNTAQFAPGGLFLLELSVLSNSIVAGNLADGAPSNCTASPVALVSAGYNLSDTAATECQLTATADQVDTDPILAALADNGGSGSTHLLESGSPAIDAGDPFRCPTVDQRGTPRPLDGDTNGSSVCDIGAIEVPEPNLVIGLVAGILLLGTGRVRSRIPGPTRGIRASVLDAGPG